MKFTLLASAAALAATALATPAGHLAERTFLCVNQYQAEKFIDRFVGVLTKQGSDLGDWQATADQLLAPQFQEISDSINSLAGYPLGSVTTPSKAAYLAGLQHAPADSGIETIFVTVANCNEIVWHWNFKGIGSAEYPIKGFNYFSMQRQFSLRNPWIANKLELEFNSIAWGLDTGYGFVLPDGTVLGTKPEGCDA